MAYGDTPVTLTQATLDALETYKLGVISGDRIILQDNGVPFSMYTPPALLASSPHLLEGLAYLKAARPEIAMLHTLHLSESDARRQLRLGASYLRPATVVGVEAFAASELSDAEIAEATPYPTERPLGVFQRAQFTGLRDMGKLIVPCEPSYSGELAERIEGLSKLYDMTRDTDVFDSTTGDQLRYLVSPTMSIYRTWGIVGQLGWWLRHPLVVPKLKAHVRVPITLGSGHQYEVAILREYCDCDVVALNTTLSVNSVDTQALGPDIDLKRIVTQEELAVRYVKYGHVIIQDMQSPRF